MMAGKYTYVFTISNIDSEISETQQIILDSIVVQNQDGPVLPSQAPSASPEGEPDEGDLPLDDAGQGDVQPDEGEGGEPAQQ